MRDLLSIHPYLISWCGGTKKKKTTNNTKSEQSTWLVSGGEQCKDAMTTAAL